MDINKFAMLKATIGQLEMVSVGYIKNILSVNQDEAEEMLQKLVQAGAVEPFPMDGINYRVRRF